ncbi:STAS domain-containing protein [Streptomyces purpurogeneiscleroticus]|uniref:STAS domain-containing protein n=1 Tax=Streptomyces purpurogeneiscleroticus TaxID=68259 RepID=UPI001CBF8FB4|nr:STAS domain-containing protein [Streptomyces purpurogeneiscleroticus]MBZ4017458.1 hypothetical protein [Streptomyces purpurogeneiscleroticus]
MRQQDVPSTGFVRLEQGRGGWVAKLRGEIDISAVAEVRPVLDGVTSEPAPRLVLVLDEVDFLDCSGIGLLCRVRRRVADRGGELVLVCRQPAIRHLLVLLGLRTHFRIVTSQEQVRTEPLPPGGGRQDGPEVWEADSARRSWRRACRNW